MDRLEQFLQAEIPHEMPFGGTVDVRVARALAYCVVIVGGDAGIEKLEQMALSFEPISAEISADNLTPAEFVKDALAFVHDQDRMRLTLNRVLEGATADEALAGDENQGEAAA